LFGKRTNVRDAHDKYANQEVSYLLQRIEDYDGLVILATNMKNNIDDAFIRRFNAVLKFPMPDGDERKAIWQKTFPPGVIFRKSLPVSTPAPLVTSLPEMTEAEFLPPSPPDRSLFIDIPELVKKYVLSGGNIANIVHYASIKGAKRQEEINQDHEPEEEETPLTIYLPDVIDGIRRELGKDGIPFA
jgi:SpoVK/Ycf46/Vps4 family AAA+-type ATPase